MKMGGRTENYVLVIVACILAMGLTMSAGKDWGWFLVIAILAFLYGQM